MAGSGDPVPVQVDEHTLLRMHNTGAFLQTLVMLEFAGQKTACHSALLCNWIR